jgi:hypothetical protein
MFQYYTDDLLDKSFSNCVGNKQQLDDLIKKCNFKNRLEKCNIQSNEENNNKKTYFEMYDWEQVRKISVLVAIVVIGSSSSRVFNKLLDANSLSTSRRAGVAVPVESTNFT